MVTRQSGTAPKGITPSPARKGSVSNLPPRYYADTHRHLVCVPYSRVNLLATADALGIGRHWLHGGPRAHVDIPQRAVQRVLADPRVQVVSQRTVLAITKGAKP